MKIQIESTEKIVDVNGVPARLWEGHSESGIDLVAFVTRIRVKNEGDLSEFERELDECVPPRVEVQEIPLRMVL